MAFKFDPITGSILEPIIGGNSLRYQSITGLTYDANAEDTLVYSETNISDSLAPYRVYIKNALADPTNMVVKKKMFCLRESQYAHRRAEIGE